MHKYRVLKSYPKQITNSGRLVTLKPGGTVYLKKEAQVVRLIKLGFLKPVVELPKKPVKEEAQPKSKSSKSSDESSEQEESRRKAKSEFLSKKNKGE